MGLFKSSRREKPALPQAGILYDIANFLLPMKAFDDVDYVIRACFGPEGDTVGIFYITACVARRIKHPDYEVARGFKWHTRRFSSSVDCYIVEFPQPEPLDLTHVTGIDEGSLSLAPHFAGIIHDRSTGDLKYYVLGQAAMGNGTTLRKITSDGMSANLGEGPRPELDLFIHTIKNERRRVRSKTRVWPENRV